MLVLTNLFLNLLDLPPQLLHLLPILLLPLLPAFSVLLHFLLDGFHFLFHHFHRDKLEVQSFALLQVLVLVDLDHSHLLLHFSDLAAHFFERLLKSGELVQLELLVLLGDGQFGELAGEVLEGLLVLGPRLAHVPGLLSVIRWLL